MKKKPFPATSRAAYESVTKEMIQNHHGKIISALKRLGLAHYEKIAELTGMEPHSVARRLKELEGMNIICKPGTKAMTKSNRLAFQYQLTIDGSPKTETQEKILKGKTISDFSKEILKNTSVRQETLFD